MAGNMMEMRFHMRLRFHQIRGLKLSCQMEEDRSWEEALQILEKQQEDLIITDVMMPKMNGYENADNQQKQFIKDFSHEFKTPINSIRGTAGEAYR